MGKKYHFIYLIESIFNGKYYIGRHSTNNLDDGYMGSGKKLLENFEKYGIDSYEKHILEFCDDLETLIIRENEIVTPETINNWYCLNMVEGGVGKKDKYYVKGFEVKEYKKVDFKLMVKDGVVRNIISYLIPYHTQIGWSLCDSIQIEKYKKEQNDKQLFDTNINHYTIKNELIDEEKIIKEEHLNWYLKRGWEISVGVNETRKDLIIGEISSKVRLKMIKKNSGLPFKELNKKINSEIKKEIKKLGY